MKGLNAQRVIHCKVLSRAGDSVVGSIQVDGDDLVVGIGSADPLRVQGTDIIGIDFEMTENVVCLGLAGGKYADGEALCLQFEMITDAALIYETAMRIAAESDTPG